MRKIKLTREESVIEASIDKFVSVDKEEYNRIMQAISSHRKDDKGHDAQIAKARFNGPAAKIISGRQLRKRLGVK